ncbi:MAG: hypothetical protein RI957_1646 [Verrucomicrobiota bacterium]|jgi:hypothetical protein
MIGLLLLCTVPAVAEEKKLDYKPPVVGAGLFSDKLGMMDKEREEYAVNLATYAGNQIADAQGSPASLAQGRRLLALSLHLAPRNRKAVVMNYQLERGILPHKVEGDYSAQVLARLLFTRGQLLMKQSSEEDMLLGRCFIEVAAEMDARNEDAVYAAELLRLDQNKVTWEKLTDVKPVPPLSSERQTDSSP